MAFNYKKKISQQTKCIVDSFINEQHKLLSKKHSLFHNIPSRINFLCSCYSSETDSWDINCIDEYFEIDGIFMKTRDNHTDIDDRWKFHDIDIFLSHIVKFGIYSWKFKIHQIPRYCDIGIWKINFDDKPNISYSFDATRKALVDPTNVDQILDCKSELGVCQKGDIITMTLNLNNNTLTFMINDKDYGLVHQNIEHTEYKAAIYLQYYEEKTKLELIYSNIV